MTSRAFHLFDIISLAQLAERLDSVLRAAPALLDQVAASPLVTANLPRQIVSLPDRPGQPVGLVMGGVYAPGQWRLDRPLSVLLLPEEGVGSIVTVDPSRERVVAQGTLLTPVSVPTRPDTVALLDEVARATYAWAARGGRGEMPDVFLEVRFGSDVYRGLLLQGEEDAILNIRESEAVLLLPNGDEVCLNCSQVDGADVLHAVEVIADRGPGPGPETSGV